MEMTYNHKLIRFIDQEVSDIYKKYSNITEEEVSLVESFIDKLTSNQIDYDSYKNYYKTKSLSEVLEAEDNIDIIKLYIFLSSELKLIIDLEEVKSFYEVLESKGYVKVDNYLFYHDYGEDTLEAMTREALEEDLEDEDVVRKLFDLDAVIYMWIFKESPRDVARQYIDDNGWMDYLDIEELGRAYTDKYDCEVQHCLLSEGCDLFE